MFTSPTSIEPLVPPDTSGKLERLATELLEKTMKLTGAIHPITARAIAEFLQPMNSYYSNLIEGHDTHPLDIERALKRDYSRDKEKRNRQKEAIAHVHVYRKISERMEKKKFNPVTAGFIREIHQLFYKRLPEEFRNTLLESGEKLAVLPGEYRTSEVAVGRHVAPHCSTLESFMNRFEMVYNPEDRSNPSRLKRIVNIAAAHHRLVWIHPFADGNGRVVRLFSDACFRFEEMHAFGLWSISRGLARTNADYKSHLANADLSRQGDLDGRGNLSTRFLEEFCDYFLRTAIDQVEYMHRILNPEAMVRRIEAFADMMTLRIGLKSEAKYILVDVFLKGELSKSDAMRITQTSDKTLKNIADRLIELGLLEAGKKGKTTVYFPRYPVKYSPMLFPEMYPPDKEMDMSLNI